MHNRCLERSGTMTRGKRPLEADEDQQPERKRPALASVIVEALKVDNLQKLCSSLEPILRRVVSEEVERALAKLGPARLNGRSSPKRIEGPDGRNLQLHFRSRLSLPLFTGGKVEGEQGAAIHIVLVDTNSGRVITSGPESSVKLDVVVLEGDFNNEEDEGWSGEEFESHVVKEREGKRPLLTGELQVTLKEGVGTLGDLTFTDNSSWIRSRKFRLGLKVASGFCEGIRIREAKTEAFTVKDHRGELYKKHYPPALNDEVWRLEKIGKDGSFHKKLNSAGIVTVEDFLRLVVRDPQRLRNILGSGMSNRMWDVLIEHAKTCGLGGKHYVYYSDSSRNVGVVFNNIYELSGFISGEQYCSADSLSEGQKVFVDTLVKKAYENWNQVIEYDSKSLLSFRQNRNSTTSRNELTTGLINYPNALEPQLHPRDHHPSMPSDQSSMDSGLPIGAAGYSESRYLPTSQIVNSSSHPQFDGLAFGSHGHLIDNSEEIQSSGNDNRVGLALGPPHSSTSGLHFTSSSQSSNPNPFEDWHQSRDRGSDDIFSEEEIRLKSHEMLENEEIQQLLRIWSMGGGGQTSINGPEEGFPFQSFMAPTPPAYVYDEDRTRPGRAVVGWLKIKAAMRWGFFIRRKAAERRAQIVELDDD